MTRRELWAFLLLIVTAPQAALVAWKAGLPVVGQSLTKVGYKGTASIDAGYFYCPYIPLQGVKLDTAAFTPKVAFKTRYGTTNPRRWKTYQDPYFKKG